MATPTPSTNTPQKHLAAFSSPAPRSVPAMLNYDSPAALGFLTDGGVNMNISMSGLGLGLSASAMGRADEDERRRRLESIIATLKTKPGRVSEEGIIKLCKKEGLEVMQEVGMLVLLIGSEAMCEIPVRNGEVQADGIKLQLNNDRYNYAETGSKVLASSLKPLPGMTKINLTLDRFSQNLEKLLRMDKLSAPENGGVSTYQAIFGVYASLKKVFEHEKKMAMAVSEANAPYASQKAEREVLCKRSGRPRINAGSCLGLSLEYWMDRRHLIPRAPRQQPASVKGKDKMDVDSVHDEYPEDHDPEINKLYSLTIECEESPSAMYAPIRISDSWVSDTIEKALDATNSDIDNILLNNAVIDWLEPPPTYLPAAAPEGGHDAMNLDAAAGRLPNIRFVAKLNPPLVVPLSVYVTIQQTLGLEVQQSDIRATTFVGLALRPKDPDPGMTGTAGETTQEIRTDRTVLVLDKDGKEEQRTHRNSLYVPKTEYSRHIESLPFQHPRQLIEILPTLRQYALATSLLQHVFGPTSTPEGKKAAPTSPLSPPLTPDGKTAEALPALQLDVTLSYSPPAPRLRIDIPHPLSTSQPLSLGQTYQTRDAGSGEERQEEDVEDLLTSLLHPNPPSDHTSPTSPLTLTLDVLPNAELVVTEHNMLPDAHDKPKDADVDMDGGAAHTAKTKRAARALEACGDVGVWAEWLRREVILQTQT